MAKNRHYSGTKEHPHLLVHKGKSGIFVECLELSELLEDIGWTEVANYLRELHLEAHKHWRKGFKKA